MALEVRHTKPEMEKLPIEKQAGDIETCAVGFMSINQGEFSEVVQKIDKQGPNDVTGALTKSLVSPNFSPT